MRRLTRRFGSWYRLRLLIWLTRSHGYMINASLTLPNDSAAGLEVTDMILLGTVPEGEAFIRFTDTDHVSLRPWS